MRYAASFSLTYDVNGQFVCVLYVHKYNEDNSVECRTLEGKLAYNYASALGGVHSKQKLLVHAFSKAKAHEEEPIS